MATNQEEIIPKPPLGFTLDQPTSLLKTEEGLIPSPPQGFILDEPQIPAPPSGFTLDPISEMPGMRALMPEEEERLREEAKLGMSEKKIKEVKEIAGIFKDPKVNYYAQKISERLPFWLLAVAGAPSIIAIFEGLQQVKNVTMSLTEKSKYDPIAHRMLSEMLPEDTPGWLTTASYVGEGAVDMIGAALIAKKISTKVFRSNLKRVYEKAKKAGWPEERLDKIKALAEKELRPETIEKEIERAVKIRKGKVPSPKEKGIPAPIVTEKAPPPEPVISPTKAEKFPLVKVGIEPKPGEVVTEFVIPKPGAPRPGEPIPWRPKPPPELPPHIEKKVAPPVKARKKVFKDRLHEAINLGGGIKPSKDYPFLNRVLPIGLYTKSGLAFDKMAQELGAEFPHIETDDDLYNMLEEIKRVGARYKDIKTGEEFIEPPAEYYEEQFEAWKESVPYDVKKYSTKDLEGIRKDFQAGIDESRGLLKVEEDVLRQQKLRESIDKDRDAVFKIDKELRLRKEKPKEEPPEITWEEIPEVVEEVREVREERDIFGRAVEVEKPPVKAPKVPEPTLFKPEEVKVKYPTGFDKRGLRKLKDVNKARETAQFYVDKGWKLEMGQTIDNKGWIRLIEKGKPGEGSIKYIAKKVKPEFLKKPEVELKIPEKKPKIVAEPGRVTDKQIEAVVKKIGTPTEFVGPLFEKIRDKFDPSKGTLENYANSQLKWLKRREEISKEIKLPEEEIPAKGKMPEDIFADAQEEARVRKMFEDVAENDRDLDILNSRVFKGLESYQSIADRHGVSRELVNKRFWELVNKLQGNKDFQNILKKRMKQMNLGPVPSKQDLRDLKEKINKYFTTTKGVAKNIDLANDKRIGSKIAEIFDASVDAKDMRRFLKQNKNVALDDFVYDVLTGEIEVEMTTLPDNIKNTLTRMRERVDKLSQLIISEGALADNTKAAFERNIGRYLAKYYRIYEQKHWSPPKEVRANFANLLKRKYPSTFGQFTEEEMGAYLDAMLRRRDFVYRPTSGRAKRIPTGHFIKRKQLDQAFKDFAGEIADPVWLYLKTVSDQATMGYNAEFLNKVATQYPDLWTKDFTTAAKRGWQEHRLPQSYGYGKLRGKYVHPDLDAYIRREITPTLSGFDRVVSKFIMNPFKASKTMGSIPTHARNFLGNVMFSIIMRNNILNPVNWPYYTEAIEVYLTKSSAGKAAWLDLIKRGVTETQFYGSEIPKVYKDLLRLDPPEWSEKIFSAAIKWPVDKIGKLYNFEDMLYRIAADIKNIKHFKMSPSASVEEINRGMTNYRKLPLVAEILRRYTLFGPFISFRWNVGKIVVNQLTQGVKETAKKGTKKKGIGRLLRIAFVLGLPSIIKEVSERILEDHYGIDQEVIRGLEESMPKHRRQGSFVYYIHDGKLKAFDLTYIWPTGEFERAIKSAIKGDVSSLTEAMSLFAHPVFDIYSVLVRGKDPYWDTDLPITKNWLKDGVNRIAEIAKSIYLPASTPLPSFKGLLKGDIVPGKLTGYQLKAIIDAYNQKVDRYGRVKSLPEEVKNFFTGLRTWNVEPDKLLIQSVRALEWERIEIANQFKSWLKNNASAPKWQIEDKKDTMFKAVEKVNKRIQGATEVYKKIKKLIKEGKL